MCTFRSLPFLPPRSHVWPALVRSTASGGLPSTKYNFLGWFVKSIQLCGCFEVNISCLSLSLFYAEWPFHQQARSELPVWARCNGKIPQPEQAGLYRAKSWGQSWGLRGHSFREVHHRVFSTQLLVGITAGLFLSHLLPFIFTVRFVRFFSAFFSVIRWETKELISTSGDQTSSQSFTSSLLWWASCASLFLFLGTLSFSSSQNIHSSHFSFNIEGLFIMSMLNMCVFLPCLQPHPNVKPMAYANTLMQMGLM